MFHITFSKKIFLGAALILLGGGAIFTAIQFGTASPSSPDPGHKASQIGGDTDAERTFAGTGKYTFLGDLDVSGGVKVGDISDICDNSIAGTLN